jgi:hypothetical protein
MKNKTLFFLASLIILSLWISETFFKIPYMNTNILNTLFTGLGIIGLITTLFLQQNQISENKKDADAQVENLKIQNFENRFFSLINNYQKNISLNYFINDKNMFRTFFNNFKSCIESDKYDADSLIHTFDKFRKLYQHLIEYSFINQITFLINIIEEDTLIDKSIYYKNLNCLFSDIEKKCLFIIINYDTTISSETKELFKSKFEFITVDPEQLLKSKNDFFTF